MTDGERRGTIRVKVDVPVRYRLDDGVERTGTVDNISRGGVLLVAESALDQKTRVRISFEDKGGKRHEVLGEVVRSAPMGRVGVSFVSVDDETLAFVRDVLGVP